MRNFKRVVLSFGLALCTGCIFTSQPYYATEPILLGESRSMNFWRPREPDLAVDLSEFTQVPVAIIVEYTIDSNGNVFSPKLLESSLEGDFEEVILAEVMKLRFEATERNQTKQPVITRSSFTVNQ